MVQVGIVTVNGRQIGTVTQDDSDAPPPVLGGTVPTSLYADPGAAAAYGAKENYSPTPNHGAPSHGREHHHHGGSGHDGGRSETRSETPAGSGPSSTTGGTTQGKNQRDVAGIAADEWQRAGMPATGTAGVMANIQEESRFDPTLRHPDQPHWSGEAHYAHGLYQEGGQEWNNYASWLKTNHAGADWRDPRLQSRFAAENLKANYPHVWQKMKGASSREEAAAAYTTGYLKPAKKYQQSRIAGFNRHGVPPLEHFTGPPVRPADTATKFDPETQPL